MHANTALCLVTILGNQALLFAPDSDPEQKNYAYSVARTGDHIPKRPTKQRKKDVLAPKKHPFLRYNYSRDLLQGKELAFLEFQV
jgi:hypothetical protein